MSINLGTEVKALAEEASALAKVIRKSESGLLGRKTVNVINPFTSELESKLLRDSPSMAQKEIDMLGDLVKNGTHSTDKVHEALNNIGMMADIGHHIPTGEHVPDSLNQIRESLHTLQANHLIAQHRFDQDIAESIGEASKLTHLKDEAVNALAHLDSASQAEIMKGQKLSLLDRLNVLDPHGIESGSELSNKALLQGLASDLHDQHYLDLPNKGKELAQAIQGSKAKFTQGIAEAQQAAIGSTAPSIN